jgi:choline/carnitine/betaine transport
MALKPFFTGLIIKTADSGFYRGFTVNVAVTAKLLIGALILWAMVFPVRSGNFLAGINGFIVESFGFWYIYAAAFFVLLCLALALWPAAGRLRLGLPGEQPEFSNFSWFSMMFGAGIGIGMLTFATAEPLYHFAQNPATLQGLTEPGTRGNVRDAYIWSFTHWGFTAWAAYAVVGLSLGYFCYRRGLPLTIRSGLTPLFGSAMSGVTGHVVDVVAVVATVLGVSQTLGFGIEQFISGMYRLGVGEWLYQTAADGTRSSSTMATVAALAIILGGSTLSAFSGVGKGIKWLSNLNMGLSFFLLSFFVVFGSTFFGLQTLFVGMWDYVLSIPGNLFTVWSPTGTPAGDALARWQGDWTIFYWAWWIAFAPFVGVFLARISRGRSVREYVLGAMIVPSVMCFIWFALVGGTAIDLELGGQAQGAIAGAGQESQLFATLDVLLSPGLAWAMSIVVVVLLLTYLVTSADSAVLIINTINAAGDDGPKARPHILFWGLALACVVGGLVVAGGLGAIRTAMVIGALPFSLVMVLMGVALIKGIWLDGLREKRGMATTIDPETMPPR